MTDTFTADNHLRGPGDRGNCWLCGGTLRLAFEEFCVARRRVLVKRVPGLECAQCGETSYDSRTAEKLEMIANGDAKPSGQEAFAVYDFDAVILGEASE